MPSNLPTRPAPNPASALPRPFSPAAPGLLLLLCLLVLAGNPDRAPRLPALPEGPACLTRNDTAWQLSLCPEGVDPTWFFSGAERAAWNEPVCWWSATASEFTRLRGVGPARGVAVAAFRDQGGQLANIEEIRGVGPALARAIRADTTTRCPLVRAPWLAPL